MINMNINLVVLAIDSICLCQFSLEMLPSLRHEQQLKKLFSLELLEFLVNFAEHQIIIINTHAYVNGKEKKLSTTTTKKQYLVQFIKLTVEYTRNVFN